MKKMLPLLKREYVLAMMVVLIISLYYPITHIYIEQDEWHNFGWQIYGLANSGFWGTLWDRASSFLPVTQVINFLNYYFFGPNNTFMGYLVLFLIGVNIILWYKNIYFISKSKIISFGSVLFGYTSIISLQSITWVIPAVGMQMAFLFVNSAIFFFLRYIQNDKKTGLIFMVLFSVLAFFSKFNSFFIFFFLPFLYILFRSKYFNKKTIIYFISILAVTFLFVGGLYWLKVGTINPGEGRIVINPNQILLNIFYIPTKALAQTILGQGDGIYNFSNFLLQDRYGMQEDDSFSQTVMAEHISIIFSLLMVVLFFFLWTPHKKYKKTVWFAFVFYWLSFMPYILDQVSTGSGFLDSRYYYLGAFGIGVLIFVGVDAVRRYILLLGYRYMRRIFTILLVVFISAYFLYAVDMNGKTMGILSDSTQKRKEILSYMKQQVIPNTDKQFIIYIEDINHPNKGLENITGSYFQTGVLYPFLVFSYDSEKISYKYFKDDELWNMNFQGVRKEGKYKTGVFYNRSELMAYVHKNNFPVEDVFSFQFDYSGLENNIEFMGRSSDLRFVKYTDISNNVRKNSFLKE